MRKEHLPRGQTHSYEAKFANGQTRMILVALVNPYQNGGALRCATTRSALAPLGRQVIPGSQVDRYEVFETRWVRSGH